MIIYILIKILGLLFISIAVIGFSTYILIYFKYNYILDIKAKTIQMKPQLILTNSSIKRKTIINNAFHKDLVSKETVLRKLAYKNTSIKTDESFFDDSDMQSDYYLVVIYNRRLNIPLLTARYYYDKTVIAKCLQGEDEVKEINLNIILKKGSVFLSDRLSGNINLPVYRQYRNYIFLLFYIEILIHNKTAQFILMARKEKYDKLLKKYLQIGLEIVGSNTHKGKEHWILLGDVKTCEAKLKLSTLTKAILIFKKLTFNITN